MQNEHDRQFIEETKELEARLLALKHRVEMNKRILASMGVQDETSEVSVTTQRSTTRMDEDKVKVEEDTARALSWMINDMERRVEDESKTEEGTRIGDPEEDPTTTPFPFPFEEGFALIRSKRSTSRRRVLWSQWSEWGECNCGRQSRKRSCLKHIGPKYTNDDQEFIPIGKDNHVNEILDEEPAPYPEGVEQPASIEMNRLKRSTLKCPPSEIEFRECFGAVCQ
ncbi:unnamed protein product [Caenorhabditis bovis]|uniref:Uncharacterized protein n=1 Tax=Caenorhabditis bovis TaxID=2654633 RepID=A0A8S1E9J8_9PELO|nr:unnamed protein product [Caenorhabditis bovis]